MHGLSNIRRLIANQKLLAGSKEAHLLLQSSLRTNWQLRDCTMTSMGPEHLSITEGQWMDAKKIKTCAPLKRERVRACVCVRACTLRKVMHKRYSCMRIRIRVHKNAHTSGFATRLQRLLLRVRNTQQFKYPTGHAFRELRARTVLMPTTSKPTPARKY